MGSGYCSLDKKDCRTTITNNEWETISFQFKGGREYKFITIMVYYDELAETPYCAHILIDNFCDIMEVNYRTIEN